MTKYWPKAKAAAVWVRTKKKSAKSRVIWKKWDHLKTSMGSTCIYLESFSNRRITKMRPGMSLSRHWIRCLSYGQPGLSLRSFAAKRKRECKFLTSWEIIGQKTFIMLAFSWISSSPKIALSWIAGFTDISRRMFTSWIKLPMPLTFHKSTILQLTGFKDF